LPDEPQTEPDDSRKHDSTCQPDDPPAGEFPDLTVGPYQVFGDVVAWKDGRRRFADRHAATKAARLLARTDCRLFRDEAEALGRYLESERRAMLRGVEMPGLAVLLDREARRLESSAE
jgi:hypothetical protein